jgi:hypothetical protein
MLGGDLSLLDTPLLRLRQQLEALAGLMQVGMHAALLLLLLAVNDCGVWFAAGAGREHGQ